MGEGYAEWSIIYTEQCIQSSPYIFAPSSQSCIQACGMHAYAVPVNRNYVVYHCMLSKRPVTNQVTSNKNQQDGEDITRTPQRLKLSPTSQIGCLQLHTITMSASHLNEWLQGWIRDWANSCGPYYWVSIVLESVHTVLTQSGTPMSSKVFVYFYLLFNFWKLWIPMFSILGKLRWSAAITIASF